MSAEPQESRTTVDEAITAWEAHDRPSSLTFALMADALYGVREQRWSDGRQRVRRVPASGYDGHGRRCLVNVYGTVVAHEDGPDEWVVTCGGEWASLLDVAEAIVAADHERRPAPFGEAAEPTTTDGA